MIELLCFICAILLSIDIALTVYITKLYDLIKIQKNQIQKLRDENIELFCDQINRDLKNEDKTWH